MKKILIVSSIILSTSLLQAFSLENLVNSASKMIDNKQQTSISKEKDSSLSSSLVSKGLKEALKKGVEYGVGELSKKDGYLNNKLVKIPLPNNLAKAESTIRKLGGDKIADNLIKSMNTAATQAAPKTALIFVEAIDKMSIEDAKKILASDDDAATKYFEKNTSEKLKKMIKPIIQKTMKENSVATYYDKFNEYYKLHGKDLVKSSGVMDMAKNYGVDKYLPQSTDENLDDYVTQKAINGLFVMISQKETDIRKNPIAQTTSLLKKVFGN